MQISLLLVVFLIAAASTSLGSIAILRARTRWRLVARGDGRPIGGPALIAGVVIVVASTVRIDLHFVIGGLLIILVGTIDDIYDLSAWRKLMGQVIAAGIASMAIARLSPAMAISPLVIAAASFVWIVFLTNAINLIDGLDGLLIGTIAPGMIILILTSISTGDAFTAILASACTGALLGFIPFNRPRARLLLGDTGSEFIGFSVALVSVISCIHRPHPSAIPVFLLIVAIPLADTAFAIVRRLANHRSIFSRDKKHIHHRLARLIGERASVILLSSLSCLTSIAAYFLWRIAM